jgi:type IV secretory pathway component VirB8
MAENSESINELKTEIAGSRERLARELQGLRYELDFPAKFRRSFRKQTGSWISAAAAVGALIALAPMRKKKIYVDARSRRKGDKKLMQTGLALAALKLVGNLARPVIMEFVKNRFFYSGESSRSRK